MKKFYKKLIKGFNKFKSKYAEGNKSTMQYLAEVGQKPKIMFIACCDSRVDPALILQCEPGDLFVVRNVANIVPPYEIDEAHHGTSAALEFGIRFLQVKHLIILGHSHCGGIHALYNKESSNNNDFINNWVSLIKSEEINLYTKDDYAKYALTRSYQNCLTFPWLNQKLQNNELAIHLWFFDIKDGEIYAYSFLNNNFKKLEDQLSDLK